MDTIKIKVNGVEVEAAKDSTILEAVKTADIPYAEIDIPTLHYLKGLNETDESGLCQVEVAGEKEPVPAWSRQVSEGMEVLTKTESITKKRKEILEQILKIHDHDCVNCTRTGNCELQNHLYEYNVCDEGDIHCKTYPIDESSIIVRDTNKCIRCKRCVAVCENIQGIGAIQAKGEGLSAVVGPVSEEGLCATNCVNCGQCITVCPVGALREQDHTEALMKALADPEKFVVVQTAPAVRAALGEGFEFPLGVDVEGRIAAALRELGFDKVFDTKFGADLTIMEEANEFLDRFQKGGVLPMMTSCCPGWIKFCEQEYPELLPNLSSCKSPHQMFGAIVKSYYAEKLNMEKENIVTVSVMPCTAKKFEIGREDQNGAGVPDVDFAITTRELTRMLKKAEIQLEAMPSQLFDEPLGLGSGAGVIFGATGGVMEAALRTATETLTGTELEEFDFKEVRGLEGTKEASYEIEGKTIKIAVVSGLKQAAQVLEKIRTNQANYHFIEVMACPGGCVNGGGQPIQTADVHAKNDLRSIRAKALYENDENSSIRKSHKNPAITRLYDEYLGKPGSEKAHQLLHTTYKER